MVKKTKYELLRTNAGNALLEVSNLKVWFSIKSIVCCTRFCQKSNKKIKPVKNKMQNNTEFLKNLS